MPGMAAESEHLAGASLALTVEATGRSPGSTRPRPLRICEGGVRVGDDAATSLRLIIRRDLMIRLRPARRIARIAGRVGIAAAVLAAPLAPLGPASAASPDAGLFGAADPTYDGVYRQSLAILGLQDAGAKVPRTAVTWLLGQQCLDGSFVAYRASIRTACPAPDPANFTGPDSNSTALAAMALAAAGEGAAAGRAARALVRGQNADGGWGYTLGGASDANSTGLALAALDRSSDDEVTAERRGLRWLRSALGSCTRGAAGLPFQPGGAPDGYASAQALLGMNTGLPMQETKGEYTKAQRCTIAVDQRIANFLVGKLRDGNGLLRSSMDPAKPDVNGTAWAVIALVGADRPAAQLTPAVRQLRANARTFVGSGATFSPAAAGTLAIVGEETDVDQRDFGGVDLVAGLLGSIRK